MFKQHLPLILLLILLAAWALFLEKTADVFVFGFPRNEYSYQAAFSEVMFPAQDGSILSALYAPARKGRPTFLMFHGNKQNIYTVQNFMVPYVQEGFGALLFDYRGYGKSEGKPSEKNMKEDGQSALNFLMERKLISPQEIILWGVSLGSTPAIDLAAEHNDWPFKATILQSPFTNTTDMAFFTLARREKDRLLAPILSVLLKPFLWDKQFDQTARIGEIRTPLLIGASRQDKVVPAFLTTALSAKAPAQTEVFIAEGGEHDSPLWFEQAVLDFINKL